jgi:hypothetical protein
MRRIVGIGPRKAISASRITIARIQYGKIGHSKGPSSQNTPPEMLFV